MSLSKRIPSLAAGAFLSFASLAPAWASGTADLTDTKPGAGEMLFDLGIVRPLSLVGTAATSVLFVVGLPFEAASGTVGAARKKLVDEPAKFTFIRPLGELQ